MPDANLATVTLSTNAKWTASDTNFHGWLVCVLALPQITAEISYVSIYGELEGDINVQPVAVPRRIALRVRKGLLESEAVLWRTDKLQPPGAKYVDYWIDATGRSITSGSALFAIEAATHTLTPPTLADPTVETELPALGELAAALPKSYEVLVGTVDGSNTAFTISVEPASFLRLFLNGMLVPSAGFSRSILAITAIAPWIPRTGDRYEAIIF